jgi:AraC-like DNA-binding protein
MAQNSGPFHHRKPGAPLSECVDFFWIHDRYLPPQMRERLLPTGTMELVFRLDDDGRAASAVSGPRSEFAVLETSRPFSAIGVHFKPGGGFPFFGIPGSGLHNSAVPLDAVWSRSASSIRDRLWEATTPAERFRVLERALLDRVQGRLNRHPGVRYALSAFDQSNGACAVNDVVDRLGLSPRRFIDVFRCEVGMSPKMFCRIRRFNEALTRIGQRPDVDWLDVALSCGYFDQAHFNHDFRAFSGINPSTYLRHRASRTHVAVPD